MASNIFDVVAIGNTDGAIKLVNSKGGKPQDHKQLAIMLATIVKKEGEDGLAQIANIHPHKELILKYHKVGSQSMHSNCSGGGCNCAGKKVSNACGCSGADGSGAPNPTGINQNNGFSLQDMYKQHQMLILGIAAIAVIAYIFKNK